MLIVTFFFFGPKLVLHLEASFFLDILMNVLNRICSFYTKWQSSSLKIIFKKFVLKKCDNLELIQFICFLWTQTHIYMHIQVQPIATVDDQHWSRIFYEAT